MIKVRLLHTATDEFIDRIVCHINAVYEEFEDGLWRPGALRTTSAEISKLVMADQLVIAEMDGEFAGCVRIQELSDRVGEFGMLAVDRRLHGQGVGRELVRFAEHHSKGNGITAMQLEVLMPRDWSHSIKDGLVAWYTRIGYRRIHKKPADQTAFPVAHMLATPCDFHVYRRAL